MKETVVLASLLRSIEDREEDAAEWPFDVEGRINLLIGPLPFMLAAAHITNAFLDCPQGYRMQLPLTYIKIVQYQTSFIPIGRSGLFYLQTFKNFPRKFGFPMYA